MKWFAYASAWAPFTICWPAYWLRYGPISGLASESLPFSGKKIFWAVSCVVTLLFAKLYPANSRAPAMNSTNAIIRPPVDTRKSNVLRRICPPLLILPCSFLGIWSSPGGRGPPASWPVSIGTRRDHRPCPLGTFCGTSSGPFGQAARGGRGTGGPPSGAGDGGVAGQVRRCLGPTGHLELRQDARHVVLHGLLGEMELLADLPVGLAVRDEGQDPLLLGGQPGQALVAHQVLALAEAVQDGRGDREVEQALAISDGPDGPDQLAGLDLLEDVPGGPGHDRGEQRLVVGEGRQHDDPGRRAAGPDLPGGLDPGAVFQADVHDHDVGTGPFGLVDGLPDRARLRGDHDVLGGLEEGPDAAAHDLVVVDEHDPERRRLRQPSHGPTGRGLAATTGDDSGTGPAGAAAPPSSAAATRRTKSRTVASATRFSRARSMALPTAPSGGRYRPDIASCVKIGRAHV